MAKKCASDEPIIRIIIDDDRDPTDERTIEREKTEAFWKDMSTLARQRYASAQTDARREVRVREVRDALLDRAVRAGGSYGAGTFVPLAQIIRLRGGLELPL